MIVGTGTHLPLIYSVFARNQSPGMAGAWSHAQAESL